MFNKERIRELKTKSETLEKLIREFLYVAYPDHYAFHYWEEPSGRLLRITKDLKEEKLEKARKAQAEQDVRDALHKIETEKFLRGEQSAQNTPISPVTSIPSAEPDAKDERGWHDLAWSEREDRIRQMIQEEIKSYLSRQRDGAI